MDHIWSRIIEHKKENRLISRQINDYLVTNEAFKLKANYRKQDLYSKFGRLKMRLFCDNIRENGDIPNNVTDLDLSYNDKITARGIPKGIKKLVLTGNDTITNDDLAKFVELCEIDLRGNKNITIEGIKKMSSLISIWLDDGSLIKILELEELTNINTYRGLNLYVNISMNIPEKGLENIKIKNLVIEMNNMRSYYTNINYLSQMNRLENITIRLYSSISFHQVDEKNIYKDDKMIYQYLKAKKMINSVIIENINWFQFEKNTKNIKKIIIEIYRNKQIIDSDYYSYETNLNEIQNIQNSSTLDEYLQLQNNQSKQIIKINRYKQS